MSRSIVQPVGQKRLTNVAVVRLKKRGLRFEIACYKNKVLSWRSGVEKDLDEVLQSHTVYSNVSKGVLAKSIDLINTFGSDDQTKICLEILGKGELQVAGKERESQLSNQFRDIATIIMEKTYNPETQRPYTISMIERLMREVHFAVDPNSNSKKQALELIRELQKRFPLKRSPMRLRLTMPKQGSPSLLEKLKEWNAKIVSNYQSGSQHIMIIICELDPGFYRDCETLLVNNQGRFEVLALSVHAEGGADVNQYDEQEMIKETTESALKPNEQEMIKETAESAPKPNEQEMIKETAESAPKPSKPLLKLRRLSAPRDEVKANKCGTCSTYIKDLRQFRDHYFSEWHKHNLKRRTRKLPPLTEEEWPADVEIEDSINDLKDYSF